MDNNFAALWTTDTILTEFKDLNGFLKYVKYSRGRQHFKVDFALSKLPNSYRAYQVTVWNHNSCIIVSSYIIRASLLYILMKNNLASVRDFMLSYSTLESIGDLCTLKCQAFHALADFVNCHHWAILAFKISRNVQMRTSWLGGDTTTSFLHHYFNVILTITACEYNR